MPSRAVRRPRICPRAGVTGTFARPHTAAEHNRWAGSARRRVTLVRAPDDGVMRGSVLALAAGMLIAGCSTSTGTSAPATPAPPRTHVRHRRYPGHNSDVAPG